MPAQCSASRSTARGHSPSRVRTATRRGWTTAPARRVHPTPQGGIERKIISLGSKLPSRGMQRRKPSSVQGLPAPGSSPEEDRAWTALTNRSSASTTGASGPSRIASPVTSLATVSPHVCLTGARGLQAQASRPSLTDHRLLTTGASSPSRVASPVTALATVSPHVEGNTPPRKSHSQCVRRPPRDGGSASRARGAYKLKRLGPHSPITGFSQPGRPAHPASPLLSPRLRRSARTWKATRPRLNPTSQCVRRPPPGRGRSSNRNDVREQGGRVKKEGTVGRGNSPTITPAHVGVITVLG
ncbi:hypothetical protein Cgig2_001720 [Carnegiea gigantea]|uniref:Uncharacterized protein n=1 Tax=Carnegiea gigantea TaxID=171969 RepID=A0A9Q1JHZ9_9CARY|nr:hypothetical protein Cgig2_001720 [Carnegiea gigantea]